MRWTPLFLLFLGACMPRPSVPVPPTLLPEVAASELIARVEQSGSAIQSLRGLARARVDGGGRSLAASQVVLAEYPDRLRAETLSPFGTSLLTLVCDGQDLAVYLPGEGRFLQGPATPRNLQRFTRLPLAPPDLIGILLYRPPRFAWDTARAEVSQDHYRLILAGAAGSLQVFTFDASLNLTGAAYFKHQDLLLQVSYSAFREDQPRFPAAVELNIPLSEIHALLEFTDFDLNQALPPERFRLSPPSGVMVEKLGEE